MPVRAGPPPPCITTMVPYHRPIPQSKQRGKAAGILPPQQTKHGQAEGSGLLPPQQAKGGLAAGPGILGAWVQAEKMIQIALMLPSAGFIGWLIGAWFDHLLNQTWIAMIGIVVGILSGLIGAIRMAMVYSADPKLENKDGDGTDNGSSDNPS